MVTRSLIPKSVQVAIRELVRISPKLSQRAVLEQVRSQGYTIANVSGRSVVNEARQEIQREITASGVRGATTQNTFLQFTQRESDLVGRDRQSVEKALRQNIRNREVFIKEGGSTARVSDFTHVVVNFTAHATVTLYIEGRKFSEERTEYSGRFITEVSAFTEELLAERIRQQLEGRAAQSFGEESGLGSNSVIEGLTAEISNITIDIDSLHPRGSAGRRS